MIKYIGTREFQIESRTAVAIGKFDGIHRGHKKLLEQVVSYRKQGMKTVIFTFDMSNASFFREGDSNLVLTTNKEKEDYLADLGIDILVEYPVNDETTKMEPEVFIDEILVKKLNVEYIIAGPDCSFGYKGRGNLQLLEEYDKKYGYHVITVPKEMCEEQVISSTRVRGVVEQGKMEEAAKLLGRYYSVSGKVCHGRQLGRTLDMPTVNLLPEERKLLPPFGVYMSKVIVGTQTFDGITNIGRKPTVSDQEKVGVETYLYDFEEDLYGEMIQVDLLHFYRGERKFGSLAELKEQLKKDMKIGEEFRRNNL